MRILYPIFAIILLSGCNSAYIKPNSMELNSTVYADRGGYTMRRVIKEELERRGHHVVVGIATANEMTDDDTGDIDIDTYTVPSDAQYAIKIKERQERFAPIWCALNGFWWWRFNVSIADQRTGEEIMSWFGYGCANSSVRKLNRLLDTIEIKTEQ